MIDTKTSYSFWALRLVPKASVTSFQQFDTRYMLISKKHPVDYYVDHTDEIRRDPTRRGTCLTLFSPCGFDYSPVLIPDDLAQTVIGKLLQIHWCDQESMFLEILWRLPQKH